MLGDCEGSGNCTLGVCGEPCIWTLGDCVRTGLPPQLILRGPGKSTIGDYGGPGISTLRGSGVQEVHT